MRLAGRIILPCAMKQRIKASADDAHVTFAAGGLEAVFGNRYAQQVPVRRASVTACIVSLEAGSRCDRPA